MEVAPEVKAGRAKVGDWFSFIIYVDGLKTRLLGQCEVTMPSAKAQRLGITKSPRTRRMLGLRVHGYTRLIWKDRGQVKPSPPPTEQRR